MLEDEMLTIEDLASYLKLKPQTIYKWAQSGKIPGAKFGKEWRFRRSAIERWIDEHLDPSGMAADGNSSGARELGTSKRISEASELTPEEKSHAKRASRERKDGLGSQAN